MKFSELKLIEPLIEAVNQFNYKEASPIQEKAIPVLLDGKDLFGCAKTGTGKTAAFALPILQMLYLRDETDKYPRTIKALILAPTRELAIQINETFEMMRPFVNLKSAVVFGGVGQSSQVNKINRGIDVLIATPGRFNDLYQQGLLDLKHVEYLVLDEADRMLDMGFIKDVRKIIKYLPKKRQTMMFSATLPKEIEHLVDEILNNPVRVMVSSGNMTVDKIHQSLYFVDKANKAKLLMKLLENPQIYNAIVFVRTKRNADTLSKKLNKHGIPTVAIHGDKSQNARVRALNDFKEDKARILVATDIAARGIDIENLTHVVNFDLPDQPENYVHRIGRTARAGANGDAITLCCYQEMSELKDVQKFIKQEIDVCDNPYYPMEDLSQPVKKGSKPNQNKPKKRPQRRYTKRK
ncbi:DEAD/DEAH box helicase [Candidatus Stoquefichus massiliensis]|uniref:DEAD/DEAH box helicase n=1 Tax=Candidatus Stoquefichus massiliensis TaxID=1470350 RepID=UPI0004B0B73D|nr:DEAD/DEAH box helicase [Candidatus Stoquefichus massiliensis]